MANQPLSVELAQEAMALLSACDGNASRAAREMGIHRATFVNRIDVARRMGLGGGGSPPASPGCAGDGGEEGGGRRQWREDADEGTAQLEEELSEPVKSLGDLIRLCEIDQAVWRIKSWSCTAWGVGMKVKVANPNQPGTTVHQTRRIQLYRVSAKLERRAEEIESRGLALDLLADLRGAAVERKKWPWGKRAGEGHCLVIDLPDVHLGKMAAERATGEAWTLDRAEQLYLWAVEELLAKATRSVANIERIYLPTGNDICHVDGSRGTTTRGTKQETLAGWRDCFRRSVRMQRAGIARCLEVAPVTVPVVWSNHHQDGDFYLGQVLGAVYDGQKHVEVDCRDEPRLYHRYGRNLWMFTHGSDAKSRDLPGVMAQEAKDLWAGSAWQEVHTGHLHQRRMTTFNPLEEVQGVMVRISPALCGADFWHSMMGYVAAKRGGEGFVYRKSGGIEVQLHANVLPVAPGG